MSYSWDNRVDFIIRYMYGEWKVIRKSKSERVKEKSSYQTFKKIVIIKYTSLIQSTYLTDIDNNGFLDQKDFDCMALRATLVEGKGNFQEDRHKAYVETMRALWKEISDLADYDKVT